MLPTQDERVTLRAALLGLALLPFTCWWLIQIEFVRYSDTPTIPQVFFHCVAILTLLVALNSLLRKLWPTVALRRMELLCIYLIQVIGSNVASHDQLQILFSTIIYLYARATPENKWETLLEPHVKHRLVVTDPQALDDLFRGHSSLYTDGHWQAWLWPLAIWGTVALTVAGTLYCLGAILRKQWDHERLTYPLAEIPLTLTEPGGELFRSLTFWAGTGLAGGVQLLNLCHQIWPAVPGINIGVTLLTISQPPWSAMGSIPICFYPFAFGLAFLLPTNLAFSCWFFFLLTRLERVVAAAFGHTQWDGFPYVNQQASGAFVGFGLLTLIAARQHLARTVRSALGYEPSLSDGEPLPYRAAWVGFLLGSAALLTFTVAAGMRVWVALTFWLLLLMIMLAVARVRAEVGLPSIELFERGADDMMRRAGGIATYRPRELAVLALFYWLNRTQRNYNLQHQLHGLRLAHRAGGQLRQMTPLIAAATIAGVICGLWAMLHVTYEVGFEGGRFTGPAPASFGNAPWSKLATSLQNPSLPDRGGTLAYLFGAAVTGLLVIARTRLVWWPLHPAGWVVANSFALLRLWVPITGTWAVKSFILRYGGLKQYRQALPFFIGLVVGEFAAGFARTLVDLVWQLYLPVGAGIGGL